MPFGVVSEVGPGIHVLDGRPRASRRRGCLAWFLVFFGICARIRLNGRNDALIAEKCIRLVCEKLTVFPYGQYIVEFKIKVGVEDKIMYKNVTLNTRKMAMPAASLWRLLTPLS